MKGIVVTLFAAGAMCASAAEVKIDFDKAVGPVKAVNGVGQPPLVGKLTSWSMLHYLKEAGIPYSRLHDVGGWLGGGMFVDIPNLFPNFDADENDPKNYRFAYTDSLMKALDGNGVEPFFRLGVTIENFAYYGYPPVNILPPKDYSKWARICEHVIRHYTEGWADGLKMKVTYWEIWNEPENHPDSEKNPMWRGDWESFMRFYGIVAPYLKSRFPHLKIGGYGHCGFYAGVGSDHVPAANSSPRMAYFVECSRKFLTAARDNKWPLDFFSYHSYSDPTEAMRQVRFADEHLSKYGFTADKCERIFNEWLPYVSHENLGSALQAAGVAAELIGLQNGPCDVACIYDARCGVGNYSPLFNPLTYKPHKAYYAFTAFNELRKRGTAVSVKTSGDRNLWVAAAKGEKDAAVMMANDSDKAIPLSCDFQGGVVAACRITDKDRTDETVPFPAELPPRSFIVATVYVPAVVIKRGPDWITLTHRSEIEPGSALDFSGMGFTDAPAGKYGWLRNAGGRFEFENRPGRPVRLYGVNICSEACYQSHEESERMVLNLKRFGYNAFRLHHHDHGMVAGSKDGLRFNAGNMDKFDYLLATAIREGFYLTTDLYVTRALAPIKWRHLGIDRDGNVSIQLFKALCAVHEPAFENWCAYARSFLTHVNPYTGRAYKDEPALSLIALVNEGGLLMNWKSAASKDERVLAAWKKWLLGKRSADPSFYPSADPDAAPKGESAVAQLFMGEMEAKMSARMKAFLRGIGCKALLTNDNWGWHYAPLQKASGGYDYIDDHFYLDHPESLGKRRLPSRCENKNPILTGEFPPCRVAFARMADKPFTVTEWHFCPPGMFRGAGGLLTGAMAALQDWGGLWHFAYAPGSDGAPMDFFNIGVDPLGMASERASICLFLRGDIAPLAAEKGVSLLVTPESVKPDGDKAFRAAPSWCDEAWNMRVGSCLKPERASPMRVIPRERAEDSDVKKWVKSAVANPAVRLNRKRGAFVIDTPRTCGGFAPAGKISAGPLVAELEGSQAAIWASSLDGSPVANSSRILLSHLTDLQGDGAKFADAERTILLAFGKGALVRNGKARIALALAKPEGCAVYGLDTGGARLGVVPSVIRDGKLTFTASVDGGRHGARMLYEIERKR